MLAFLNVEFEYEDFNKDDEDDDDFIKGDDELEDDVEDDDDCKGLLRLLFGVDVIIFLSLLKTRTLRAYTPKVRNVTYAAASSSL